jgi:hypothetical protein
MLLLTLPLTAQVVAGAVTAPPAAREPIGCLDDRGWKKRLESNLEASSRLVHALSFGDFIR